MKLDASLSLCIINGYPKKNRAVLDESNVRQADDLYLDFLRSMLPWKTKAEIYTMLGLQKQGKNTFYRDFMHHLQHSNDDFIIAPGIRGLVMLVFTLPSYPFVFKLIKDVFGSSKDVDRPTVKAKYLLVKRHDRVGRMADTLEYSLVAFPRSRFSDELIEEIRRHAPSQLEISDRDGDGTVEVIIKHVYIERRMIPLNIYLHEASPRQMEHAVIEYGNAIKDLVAANIFPGDMLWKNFGVTRDGKVVFYDYDEIEYVTDCNFRKVPEPRNEEDEMSGKFGTPWGRMMFFLKLLDPSYWAIQLCANISCNTTPTCLRPVIGRNKRTA